LQGRFATGAFKARPPGTDRLVALKVIRSDRQEDVQFIRRFQREARTGRRLDHPNIVAIYHAPQVENTCLLTMEFVDGTDLAQLLKQTDGPLPVSLACGCARQTALGLQHAHERGLVHRDIKLSNLLLTKAGDLVKILDMGDPPKVGGRASWMPLRPVWLKSKLVLRERRTSCGGMRILVWQLSPGCASR
jgi:serine/threonine protein kinase